MSSNIPSTIFYRSIFSELLPTASCTLRIDDFIPGASDLFSRMMEQDENSATFSKQLKKPFLCCPTVCQKFDKTQGEVNISIMKNT